MRQRVLSASLQLTCNQARLTARDAAPYQWEALPLTHLVLYPPTAPVYSDVATQRASVLCDSTHCNRELAAARSATSCSNQCWGSSTSLHRSFATQAQPASPMAPQGVVHLPADWIPPMPNPAVPFRKPTDVVDRGSKALKHFSRAVTPQVLIYRITNRRSLYMIPDLLRLYQNKLTCPVISAVLSKIGQLQRLPSHGPKEQAQATAIVASLHPFLQFQTIYADLPAAAGILWGWARLLHDARKVLPPDLAITLITRVAKAGPASPEPRLSGALYRNMQHSTPGSTQPKPGLQQAASSSSSSSREGGNAQPSRPLPGALHAISVAERLKAAKVRKLQGDWALTLAGVRPQVVSTLLWGAAHVIPPTRAAAEPRLLAAVEAVMHHTRNNLRQHAPQGLAMLAWAVPRLHPAEGQRLLPKIAEQVVSRLGNPATARFKPVELAAVVTACTQAGLVHAPLYEKVAAVSVAWVHRWRPAPLVALATAFAGAGVRHEGLMQAVAQSVLSRLLAFKQEQCVAVIEACKAVGCQQTRLEQATAKHWGASRAQQSGGVTCQAVPPGEPQATAAATDNLLHEA
ncbi:hypothetical protein QJQ45_010429 [Haematococcus lacustris]|nr:hypothetical protein QJQ45_010429 [Haematococcus lacustris]